MPKIAVIIPAINLWSKYSKQCIESVRLATDARILFIDNKSEDETLVEAGKLVSDNFAHKRNEERWSFSQSVNYGVKDALDRGCTHVLVLNNDILIHPKMIKRMLERFEKGDVGMVTAMDVRGQCTSPRHLYEFDDKEYETCPESPHPNFSAFMVSKECWEKVGEFDENYLRAYWEDNDFHRRMNIAGIKAIVYPPAMFYHYGSRTQNEALGNGQAMVPGPAFENNRAYYVAKWGGLPDNETFEKPFGKEENSWKSVGQNGVVR